MLNSIRLHCLYSLPCVLAMSSAPATLSLHISSFLFTIPRVLLENPSLQCRSVRESESQHLKTERRQCEMVHELLHHASTSSLSLRRFLPSSHCKFARTNLGQFNCKQNNEWNRGKSKRRHNWKQLKMDSPPPGFKEVSFFFLLFLVLATAIFLPVMTWIDSRLPSCQQDPLPSPFLLPYFFRLYFSPLSLSFCLQSSLYSPFLKGKLRSTQPLLKISCERETSWGIFPW